MLHTGAVWSSDSLLQGVHPVRALEPAEGALRWIDSSGGSSDGRSWQGLTIDDASGGLRSTATVSLPPGGPAPGASVSVEFCFAVQAEGKSWFDVDVDAA